ncbi:hypothetical protein D3C84_1176610 [compost metagenome]
MQADGVEEYFTAKTLAEQELKPAQVGDHGRAAAFALDVHHVDRHHLAAHQVVVKAQLAAVMGVHWDIGEATVSLAR